MKRAEFNLPVLNSELEELAGDLKVKIKLDNSFPRMISCKETDAGYFFTINPARVRGKNQLEYCLNFCRGCIS